MTQHAVEISTTEYEFRHSKQPRGYGQWAFFFDNDPEPFWATGSFADAKKSPRAYAVSKGHRVVKVGA